MIATKLAARSGRSSVRARVALALCTLVSAGGCGSGSSSPDQGTAGGSSMVGVTALDDGQLGGTNATGSLAAAGNNGGESGLGSGLGVAPDQGTEAPSAGEASGGSAGMAGGSTDTSDSKLPCEIQAIVSANCWSCHGQTPIGGAPMPLTRYADFHAMGATAANAGRSVYEVVHDRINNAAMPMPPGNQLQGETLATFNRWLESDAPAAAANETCAGANGAGGEGGIKVGEDGWQPPQPGETCYEFPNHGGTGEGDNTPYTIEPGENYEQFYYAVPWDDDARATRFGTRFDNQRVLHHWLLYTSSKPTSRSGTHETVIGTVLDDPGSQLLAGWAVGGQDVLAMPDDVEYELPGPGTLLNAQWHFYNTTGTPQQDNSAIMVCTVPAGTREHVAAVTWLGTENFFGPVGMPPGYQGDFGGTCLNDSGGPIHIFDVTPHMHQIGRHMKAEVTRANGTKEVVFDEPFDFNFQVNYKVDITLMPGDSITATCTFENTRDFNVPFGPSSDQEMCYLFTNSYPAGALANGAPSLAGATNTCW